MSTPSHGDHLVNLEVIRMARQQLGGFQKQAFIPASDPGMGAGGGGGGGGGGAPPMDPAMMGGGGGGAPPPDPAAGGGGGGGGGGLDPIMQMMTQMQQQIQQLTQGGGAGGGAGGALKPKIDVNVEMMQIKNMLAKICDHLGIQIPAQDMVATPEKLMAMSQGQSAASPPGTGAGGAGAGGAGAGAIPPMDPMQGMQPAGSPGGEKMGAHRPYRANGQAYDGTALASGLGETHNRAAAIMRLRQAA